RDVLVHRPAPQPVEVPRQALVLFGHKCVLALQTLVDRGPAFDHPPLDAAEGQHQVEGDLLPRGRAARLALPHPGHDFGRAAGGAAGADHRDAPAHPEVLPLALLAPLPGLLQRPARSYINPVPLVVEVGAIVDLLELGLDEVDATPLTVI